MSKSQLKGRPESLLTNRGGGGVVGSAHSAFLRGYWGAHEMQSIRKVATHCHADQRHSGSCPALDTIPQKFQKSVTNSD
jgi:hypothetical protein